MFRSQKLCGKDFREIMQVKSLIMYNLISQPVTPWSLSIIIITPRIYSVQEKIANTEYSRLQHGYIDFHFVECGQDMQTLELVGDLRNCSVFFSVWKFKITSTGFLYTCIGFYDMEKKVYIYHRFIKYSKHPFLSLSSQLRKLSAHNGTIPLLYCMFTEPCGKRYNLYKYVASRGRRASQLESQT